MDLSDNSDFVLINKIKSIIDKGSKILEISCGNGADAIELDKLGYKVSTTEFNEDYIDNINSKIGGCIKLDTRDGLPYKDLEFDLIYSRLGLHYFSPDELNYIFGEISRVTNRYFIFTVKLKNDNLSNHKIILDKEFWEKLVNKNFNIISSERKSGELYNNESIWLEVVCEKK